MSQLLQLMMLLLLVLFLLGKSDGDSNSLRFLLRLYMVLKALAGNSSLRFSSLCKSGKYFFTRVSILGRLGLKVMKKLSFLTWLDFTLGLRASDLVSFSTSSNCFFTDPGYNLCLWGISVVFKAHTWISRSDNETSYLCFIVEYLLNIFYSEKILVSFNLPDGYICFCSNTYLQPSWNIFFEVGCLFHIIYIHLFKT